MEEEEEEEKVEVVTRTNEWTHQTQFEIFFISKMAVMLKWFFTSMD